MKRTLNRVLIIDDNELFLKMFHDIIKMHYPESYVRCIHDGLVAMKEISDNYDLFIIDVQLDAISGLEIVRLIKKNKLNGIVCVATAFAMKGDQDRILEAGADVYFAKPVPLPAILKMIKENFH